MAAKENGELMDSPTKEGIEAVEMEKPELTLKEWSPFSHLLSKIPMKAQKGFTTLELTLTCIAALPEFLILGTNVGLIYWYNRKTGTLERLKIEHPTTPVTCISVVSSVEYMIAAGNKDGLITIFQIPKQYDEQIVQVNEKSDAKIPKKKAVQIFSVKDMHRSPITALEWSTNGVKLFGGDSAGVVTLTEMDYSLGVSKSLTILDEKYEIVQLSYAPQNLVISSTFRTIVYATETKQSIKIGSQDRKFLGAFGACLTPGSSSQNRTRRVYSSRPGLRIWVAGLDGAVQNTLIFKDLLANPHLNIPVINPVTAKSIPSSSDAQFGTIYNFLGKYLVSWWNDILYVVDPENIQVIGSCSELRSINSLAVCQDEIFVLDGDRSIVRISVRPDLNAPTYTRSSSGSTGDIYIPPDIMTSSFTDFRLPDEIEKPLNYIASKFKETKSVLPKFNGSLFHTIKSVIEADMEIQDGQFTVLPLVVPLKETNIPNITIQTDTSPPTLTSVRTTSAADKEKFDRISQQSYEDVVLAQGSVGRKIGKRKRGREREVEPISDSTSLSSHYSSNSEGDNILSSSAITEAQRKSSVESNSSNLSTSVTPVSEQHSPEGNAEAGTGGIVDDDYIPGLANVRFYNQKVCSTELESKEQMLAKLLNWTDLLPSSSSGSPPPSGTSPTGKDTLDISFGEKSEPSSMKTITPEDVDSGVVDGSGSSGTVVLEEDERSLSVESNSGSDEGMDDDTYDSSIDIYKRYGNGQGDTLSLNSNFSFGPPSGSSNLYYTTEGSRCSSLSGSSTEEFRKDLLAIGEPLESSGDLIEASLLNLGLQDMKVEGSMGNDHWAQYKLPTSASALTVCDKYVVYIDTQNSVFYSGVNSGDLSLRWVKADYAASQIALSPSGSVVWRIDTKRVLHSLTFPSTEGPTTVEGEWIQLLENVKFAAVEESVGWIVKTDGSVHICRRIKEGLPIPKPAFEPVPTAWVVTQLCIFKSHVWALTSDGRLLHRSRVSVVTPLGEEWVEVKLVSMPPISAFGVGPNESLWMVDVQNKIHFMSGVKQWCDGMELYVGEERPVWDILVADYIFQPHGVSSGRHSYCKQVGRHWKNRLVDSLRPTHLASFLQAKAVPLLCASSSSVWFTMAGTGSVYVNKTSVTGHRWDPYCVSSGLKTMKWTDIYASSIYRNHGFLWLMDSKRKLYYCNPKDRKLQPMDLPPNNCQFSNPVIHVASAPEALWILTAKGNIYGRCHINSTNDLGSAWERIQLSPLENVRIVHLSCGSEVVWACDSGGIIYMRLGSLDPPGSNDISPAWVQVDSRTSTSQGLPFTKVYVGTTGHMVWALDSGKNVFAREAVFPDLPIGTDWVHVSGIEAVCLAISDSAVWALSPKGEIFRRYGISKTNFVGDYWRKIPGTAVGITASLCDEIWSLDGSGYVHKHSAETQEISVLECKQNQPKMAKALSEDGDWELIG